MEAIPGYIFEKPFQAFSKAGVDSAGKTIGKVLLLQFTPPYGPHHGGIYESVVKATKNSLLRET